ncbi:MAG: P-protein [Syntrophorhabdus sp. PtaU1.Bin058]|nr:MAG: P-protein [Syntrophorhabdus sp. PtaU1.Bin058]
MDIQEIRKRIDLIDFEIINLLHRRMELALRLKRLKDSVFEPEREMEVLGNVRRYSQGIMLPEFAERLYTKIIDESKRIQQQGLKIIGFQGEHGAYSEAASLAYEPSLIPVPCREFREVFEEVGTGQLDFGIVPVENSLEGAITEVNDLLIETGLKVVGEISIPVRHCLLALPGTECGNLKVVYSHPQALAQCRGFIARHGLEPRPFYDTAGAARMLSDERPQDAGVIASRLCAELYHLEVVKEDVEDHESNVTRFIVLSKHAGTGEGNKCSVVFSLRHEAGALFSVMKIFSDAGINLTRIESRPIRTAPGNYAFFLDFEGSDKDARVAGVLDKIGKGVPMFKFLGCYKGRTI